VPKTALLSLVCLALGAPDLLAAMAPELEAEMRAAGFSESQISRAEAGVVVSRVRRLQLDNAAFVVGVAKIACPEARLVEQIRDIGRPGWRPGGGRLLQAGRFGTPPTLEDLGALRLERRDLRDLKRCRVGDCDLQLDRRTMSQARAIDWRSRDSEAVAGRLLKSMLVARVTAYLRDGRAGMAVYDDGDAPQHAAAGLEYLLQNSPGVRLRNPPFFAYLLRFPSGTPPPGLEQFVFWSKLRTLKPVVSIVQAFIQQVRDASGTRYDIAMKHVYDSHFFLAYVEVMTLLPRSGAEDDGTDSGFYLLRSISALINPPRGWLRGILLQRIRRGMRDQLAEELADTKRRLESLAAEP
jgi:hypothetical protein